MYHWRRKVRKIWHIICIRYWDKFSRCENLWGCKCFSHCHRIECLLANLSCTCSCPFTQHSVGGNDNHWSFFGADPGRPAGCSGWSFIRAYQRRCHALNRGDRSKCIIACESMVSACIFYQISLGCWVAHFHDRRGVGNPCYWRYVLICRLCFHLTNAIVHPLFTRIGWI
jgi:hypothetical protein